MSSPARRPPGRRAPPNTSASRQTRLRGSGTATPEGSATQTLTAAPPQPEGLVLRLRGAHSPVSTEQSASDTEGGSSTGRRRRIQWAEDVIDNEGLGRKKSKVCCIFHKTREVGESSDEEHSSDDSSSSDDDSGNDDGGARMAGGKRGSRRGRKQTKKDEHDHGDDCAHGEARRPSPNAYERMPKHDVKPLERQPGK